MQGGASMTKNSLTGVNTGSMSLRNRNLVEEEQKEVISLSDVANSQIQNNFGNGLQQQNSFPPGLEAADKEGQGGP